MGAPGGRGEHLVHLRAAPGRRERLGVPADHAGDELPARQQHRSSGSRRRSARRRRSATRCRARSTRSPSTSRTASRASGGQPPAPRGRHQPVQHAEHPRAQHARVASPRVELLERRGIPLERRQRDRLQRRSDASISPTPRSPVTRRATPRRSASRRTSRCRGCSTTSWRSTPRAAAAGDNRGGRGPFYVGGFIDLPLVNVVRNTLIQGGVELRGYPVVAEAGNYYGLFNAEYRFPILNVDRGLVDAPDLPQPHHRRRLRRLRQRVLRPHDRRIQDRRRRRALVRSDARVRPGVHVSSRIRQRARERRDRQDLLRRRGPVLTHSTETVLWRAGNLARPGAAWCRIDPCAARRSSLFRLVVRPRARCRRVPSRPPRRPRRS